jgi:hypothetical protein
MSKDPNAVKAYLRLLGNPYAKLQIDDGRPDDGEVALREPTAEERAYAVKQGNQYTLLSVAIAERHVPSAPPAVAPQRSSASKDELSKADFVTEARRVFRPYIPAAEKGRLRRHHQDFITRNQNRSPAIRHALIKELGKYDLTIQPGISAQFNRERDLLTEHKLRQIERSVLPKEEQ